MKCSFVIVVMVAAILLICNGAAYAGATIPLTSDSSIDGHVTSLSFPAPYQYVKITDVNSIVSRMSIRDSNSGKTYYDARPVIGQSITLPPGDYSIACWSNFGNNIPQSVTIFLTDGSDSVQYVTSPATNYPTGYIGAWDTYYTPWPPAVYPGCGGGGIPYYYYSGYGNCGGAYYNSYNCSGWGIRINATINIK